MYRLYSDFQSFDSRATRVWALLRASRGKPVTHNIISIITELKAAVYETKHPLPHTHCTLWLCQRVTSMCRLEVYPAAAHAGGNVFIPFGYHPTIYFPVWGNAGVILRESPAFAGPPSGSW